MVKAGVFLLARLWPALSGTEMWFLIVTGVGLVTMLVGAWIALFKDDLKAILAYSTVSHLGLMTMLLGFGTKTAATVAVFHILNHATFKAALFMSAGIVDHETHTRDIKRLGGLLWLMPISGTLALLATASMAGVPLLNGFLSKELMLEAAFNTTYAGIPAFWPRLPCLRLCCRSPIRRVSRSAFSLGPSATTTRIIRTIRHSACGFQSPSCLLLSWPSAFCPRCLQADSSREPRKRWWAERFLPSSPPSGMA